MKVILHADDFGFDKDTTESTIELLECGALTSASIMVKMPASKMALEYARKHPEKSFGVHLTYVDGLESCATDISSLVDANGVFLPSNDVRKRALMLKLKRNDIVRESLAQIKVLTKAGIKVSHLDSHGHLHKFPSFLLALNDITRISKTYKVRRVQNIFIEKPMVSPTTILNRMFASYIARRFKSTDYFFMSTNALDINWSDAIIAQMDKLPHDTTIEVGVHPGRADTVDERWRIAEYNDVKEFAEKIGESGKHKLITWNEV